MQNIASFPVMTFFVSAHSWFYSSLTTILMLLKLPQLSPIAKKQPLEKNFIPWNMEPTWLRAAQMQMPGYMHNFSPQIIIMGSQFYCLPGEIFGLHIFILNAPEQTVPATQMNKMLNRCKWLLSYSCSDNQLMQSSQVIPYLPTNNLRLSIMLLFPLNIDYIYVSFVFH